MKRARCLGLLFASFGAVTSIDAQHARHSQTIDIKGATVVAFYPPSSKKATGDADSNEALSDFQFYAQRLKQPFSSLNITFKEVYAPSFRVHKADKTSTFHPLNGGVGYYLISPGKRPLIEYGVMTDADLLLVAKRYFASPAGPKSID